MIRSIFIASALLSPFVFPYPVTILLSSIASFYLPFIGLVVGILSDILYLEGGKLPLASLIGLSISLIAILVHRFIKARIIGG
jgi:hypothetical protein